MQSERGADGSRASAGGWGGLSDGAVVAGCSGGSFLRRGFGARNDVTLVITVGPLRDVFIEDVIFTAVSKTKVRFLVPRSRAM